MSPLMVKAYRIQVSARQLRPSSQGGSLPDHICYDTGPRLTRFYLRDSYSYASYDKPGVIKTYSKPAPHLRDYRAYNYMFNICSDAQMYRYIYYLCRCSILTINLLLVPEFFSYCALNVVVFCINIIYPLQVIASSLAKGDDTLLYQH